MKSIAPATLIRRIMLTLCWVVTTTAFAQAPVTVVEYYNKTVASYFLTGRVAEQATLDTVADFQRTGMSFVATAAAGAAAPLDSVCRYRINVTGSTFSSHFYGLSADCAVIASLNLPNFSNEGFDFAVEKPNAGACPASSPVRIYRSLRSLTPVDVPNHRYTTSLAAYQEMTRRGWIGEGAVFCAKSATAETPRPTFAASSVFEDRCAVPRVDPSPVTGQRYADRQGTLDDEKNWLRSWKDENYLWYREIPNISGAAFATAVDYYNVLETPALVPSGKAKDRFSFSQTTKAYEESSIGGASFGYGFNLQIISNTPPRKRVAFLVTPGSNAALAGVQRGDSLLSIDGADLVNAVDQTSINKLNAGLFPTTSGEVHRFVFQPADGSALRDVQLTAGLVTTAPVPVQGVIQTPTGKVGYVALTTFNTNSAEAALVNAFAGLQTQGLSDLVLDLRYNGGGLLLISSQLGYMIAGPARTNGKLFSTDKFNDKLPFGIFGNSLADVQNPFLSTTQGRSVTAGQALPTLNLGRVFVLTSGSSCSASESLINGLLGVDVEVILVGSTTCGKPYGFYPWDNCGQTYYSIQISETNHKGRGDYVEGFNATCAASDDLTRQLGDVREGQLVAALTRRASGSCAPAAPAAISKKVVVDASDALSVRVPSNETEQLLILERPGRERQKALGLPKIVPAVPKDLGAFP